MVRNQKDIPRRLTPKMDVLRVLFAKSGNQCAFPGCKHEVVSDAGTQKATLVTQVCHIRGALPTSPRFDYKMTNEERRQGENLLLLCYKHHVLTDNVELYDEDSLVDMKKNHESLVKHKLQLNEAELTSFYSEIQIEFEKIITETHKDVKAILASVSESLEIQRDLQLKSEQQTLEAGQIDPRIDVYVKLIAKGKVNTAYEGLFEIKNHSWDKLNQKSKYKLLINLGVCSLQSQREEEAAEYFELAGKHNTKPLEAKALLAIGLLFQGKTQESKAMAMDILGQDNTIINAQIALINSSENAGIEEIVNNLPKQLLKKAEISYTLGQYARKVGDYQSAIVWLQTALEDKSSFRGEILATLGTTILMTSAKPTDMFAKKLDNSQTQQFRHAINILTEAWEIFENSELRDSRYWVLMNLSLAYRMIGNAKEALKTIQKAHAIASLDDQIIIHYALALTINGQPTEALDFLQNSDVKDRRMGEFEAMIHQLLFSQRKFEELLAYNANLNLSEIESVFLPDIQNFYFLSLLQLGLFEDAETFLSNVEDQSKDALYHIQLARLKIRIGEINEALKSLQSAERNLSRQFREMELLEVADTYYDVDRFLDAARCYKQIVEETTHPNILEKLVHCLYKGGETNEALLYCDKIVLKHGLTKHLVEVKGSILEYIGDLPEAQNLYKSYLSINEDNHVIRTRLCLVLLNQGNIESLQHEVTLLDQVQTSNSELLFKIATINFELKRTKIAMEQSYQARHIGYNEAKFHEAYINQHVHYQSQTDDPVHLKSVECDSAVTILSQSGYETKFIIVAVNPYAERDEIELKSSIAQQLVGKKVSAEVSIDRVGGVLEGRIIEIRTKNAWAFLDSTNLLSSRFAGSTSFQAFKLNENNPRGPFGFILDKLDEQESFEVKLNELFATEQATVGTYSEISKINPIKAWSRVTADEDLGLNVYSSNPGTDKVWSDLQHTRSAVVELCSLISLSATENLDLLKEALDAIYTTQSTIDTISALINDLKSHERDGLTSVMKHRGEYVKSTLSAEEISEEIKKWSLLINWIRSNTKIHPVNEALTINREKKQKHDKLIGPVFCDALLLAKELKSTLIADEFNLRSLAHTEYKVSAMPFHFILTSQFSNSEISQEQFEKPIISLVKLNYRGLPVNANILFSTFQASGFELKWPFTQALKSLESKYCTQDSAINVCVNFISLLLRQTQQPSHTRQFIVTNTFLHCLDIMRQNRNEQLLQLGIKQKVQDVFRLDPINMHSLIQIVDLFYGQH